jgi:hypothetical protein
MSAETVIWGVAKYLGSIFHELARERESQIEEKMATKNEFLRSRLK